MYLIIYLLFVYVNNVIIFWQLFYPGSSEVLPLLSTELFNKFTLQILLITRCSFLFFFLSRSYPLFWNLIFQKNAVSIIINHFFIFSLLPSS